MELMSSLLFCALVAHLPQALGLIPDPKIRKSDLDIKFNNSMMINQMPMQKKILLNINGPPLVNMVTDLQIVFMDVGCNKCINCMERAIKAYKSHYYILKSRPRSDELQEEVLKKRLLQANRKKREAATATEKYASKTKRTKPKKTKSVSVTKYNVDGDVYALKVKETNTQVNAEQLNDTQVSTCRVYSVKKSFPCDTPDADSFLTVAKRKVNKKSKKEKERHKVATTTTEKPHFLAPAFRKRQVDNSQVPENFMPSIEELY
uniref:HMA domain-containing protein n=1 Tax=Heliothis virescens TaxID=7102 RepID=A0A2A4K3N0_HELVI